MSNVDEFGPYLAEQLRDPHFANAYRDAGLRFKVRQQLVALRHEKGLTQQEVAEHMGIKQPSLAGFEGGEGDPRLSTLQRYARAVGMELTLSLTTEGTE